MPAALAITFPCRVKALRASYAPPPAANDNALLHLVDESPHGACDALGRLTSATGPWGSSNYKYPPRGLPHKSKIYSQRDALGNILEKKVGNRTIGMTYNSTNRLTSHVDLDGSGNAIAGTSVNLSYDTRGNVTGLGAQLFTYDLAEQPRKLLGTVAGDYTYDGNLKRVKAVVAGKTIYNVYDAGGTLVHVDEATDGNKTDYIGKIVRIKNGTPTWLHMDHLGSAQTGTDALGAIAWREKYTPYGTTLTNPASNNDQAGFTGHIKDSATGLTYMQARYYDPLIGRFLSIDPVGFSVRSPGSFNRFSYTFNDPINRIDPDGEDSYLVSRKVVGNLNHAFVVVVDDNGAVTAQYSSGPQRGILGFRGKLVSHGRGTRLYEADAKAFKSLQNSSPDVARLNISAVKINASDPTVIAAGEAVNAALGTVDNPASGAPNYDLIPIFKQANSNSGGNAIRTLAETYDGNEPSTDTPPGGSHPGADQKNNVPSASFSISGGAIYGSRASGSRIKRKDE
jgi:RHS repeat-associated protein